MTPLWLIYHVPKTGGQSLRDAVVRQLGHGDRFLHLGPWGAQQTGIASAGDVAALAPGRRARLHVVAGHPVNHRLVDIFPDRRIREVVILRDPAERIVSSYNFFRSRPPRSGQPPMPFDDWYRQHHYPDLAAHWLSKRFGTTHDPGAVATRLATCTFVGRTPNLSRCLPLLLHAMGLEPVVPPRSNVTGTHHPRILTLDGPLRQRLTRENPGDTMLYRMARTLERCSLNRLETWGGRLQDQGV